MTKTFADTLNELLSTNYVKFSFLKLNGETRVAYGTRKHDVLEEHNALPTTDKKPSPEVIVFFDCEKMAWRSCRRDNVLEIHEWSEKPIIKEVV